jgi:hypothetical protein
MIGAIEIPAGYDSPKLRSVITAKTGKRYLIFDPTWTLTPFGQLENNLQGSSAVLLEGSNPEVVQLPILDPDLNHVRRTAKLQLAADGSLKGDITEKRFGDLAETSRYVIEHDDAKKLQEFLDRKVAQDLTSASITDFKSDGTGSLNTDLTMSFHVNAEHYATAAGPLLMVRPRVMGRLEMPVDHEKRKVDIDLEETMSANDEVDIDLPTGYVMDELPPPVKVDMGFATYESTSAMNGNTLHYSRHYAVRQVTLPADRYKDLQKLAGIIAEDEENAAILRRAQ